MSPVGEILLAADDAGLTGLWFEGSKYFAAELPKAHIEQDTPVLLETLKINGISPTESFLIYLKKITAFS